MVGALADWFAVTALFRHPLGLPIPHTAIIPRRKDQIGRSLGEFVQGNFLTREVLAERLAGVHVGQRLGAGWPSRRTPSGRRARSPTPCAARSRCSTTATCRRPSAASSSGACGRPRSPRCSARPSTSSVEGGHHQRLLDAVLTRRLAGFLDENRGTLRDRLEQESPWWVPEPIDDRIFNKIFSGVQRFLADVARRARPRGAGVDRGARPHARRPPARRPGDDRQGRGAQARAAVAPRGAGVAAVAVGRAEAGDAGGRRRSRTASCAAASRDGLRQCRRSAWRPTRAAGEDRRLGRAGRRLRRRQLPRRGRRPHRHDRRALGRRRHVAAHRAAGRPRPPVHPHQRHRRRRPRRPGHPRRRRDCSL